MAIDPITASSAAAAAAPILKDALGQALKLGEQAAKDVLKTVKCKLYPCRCTVEQRAASFKATFGTLINEAKAAAKGGDWVSAYALADAASELGQVQPFLGYVTSSGSKPPNCTWTSGPGLYAQKRAIAEALREGYQTNAGDQLSRGGGGTHRVRKATGGATPLLLGGAVILGLFLAAGAGKKKNGNGGR